MTEEVKPIKFYAHSTHVRNDNANAVVVAERILSEDENHQPKYTDHLSIIEDPMRAFWITKPQFRNHEYKKEFEDLDKLDEYHCHDSELKESVSRALGRYKTFGSLRMICASPYVYGADIDTEVLVKQKYMERVPVGKMAQFTRGALDIETEVTGQKRINLITFIHEKDIYSVALKEFMRKKVGEDKYEPASIDDAREVIDRLIGSYITKNEFKLHLEVKDTELEMIQWIFDRIHERKTTFIGIWNENFDLPKIIESIERNGGDVTEIMAHPDVPKKFRSVHYYEDKSEVDHFTDKWHWMSITGYSQFVDSMCLYARNRKVNGRDTSYALDDISTKELGQGKLHFGKITNHTIAQLTQFLEYWAYNINDVLIMMLMEWKNNDMTAMQTLSGQSLLNQFSRQTVQLKNDLYKFAKNRGRIIASAGPVMFTKYDDMMGKAGGTVLPPDKAVTVGIAACRGMNRPTQVCIMTNDLDVSSMYPSVLSAFNISKETTLATIIGINGYPPEMTEIFCSGLIQPEISAEEISSKFYGLASYTEMLEMVNRDLPKAG